MDFCRPWGQDGIVSFDICSFDIFDKSPATEHPLVPSYLRPPGGEDHLQLGEIVKKFLAVFVIAVATQACSADSPSRSEAERAVKAAFSDCPGLAVENFELVNGMKVNETVHRVEVKYDLRVIPISADKAQASRQLKAEREAELRALGERTEALQARLKELDAEAAAIEAQSWVDLNAQGITRQSPDWYSHYERVADGHGRMKVREEMKAINRELRPEIGDRPFKPAKRDPATDWGPSTCYMKSGVDFTVQGKMTQAILEGQVTPFHLTFPMVKTDNGWMRAR